MDCCQLFATTIIAPTRARDLDAAIMDVKSLRPLDVSSARDLNVLGVTLVRGRVAEHEQQTDDDREQGHWSQLEKWSTQLVQNAPTLLEIAIVRLYQISATATAAAKIVKPRTG